MLKNALMFAIGGLALAFAAPSLLPVPGERPGSSAPTQPAAAPSSPVVEAAAVDPPSGFREASIAADRRGQYLANALIDGQDVAVMVDTGATVVALTAETAARLGVAADPGRPMWKMSTANGVSLAAPVMLKSVSLGSIYMSDVQAIVMPPGASTMNLLGASFLKRLVSVEQRAGMLVLRQ